MGRIASQLRLAIVLLVVLPLGATILQAHRAFADQRLAAKIAYLHKGDIYLFDVASSQTTQITTRRDITNLSWSSDGEHIAFEANGGTSSDIYTMNADGIATMPVATTTDDEMTPYYYGSDTVYYVKRIKPFGETLNTIVAHSLSREENEVYREVGGICMITNLYVPTAEAIISRDCGRGKNVSITGIEEARGTEKYLGQDKCQYGGVGIDPYGSVATIQTECETNPTTAKIAIFNSEGHRTHVFRTPDDGFGLIDRANFGSSLVYGNQNGLWLVNIDTGKATKLSSEGGPPRWWQQLPPPLPTEYEVGMPRAGQPQANDLLAWGALVACIAIVGGLVLISRRRRKGGDGL